MVFTTIMIGALTDRQTNRQMLISNINSLSVTDKLTDKHQCQFLYKSCLFVGHLSVQTDKA